MRYLKDHDVVEFYDFFSPSATVPEVIVIFLALLELAKERLVEITQSKVFGMIYVRTIEASPTV